MEMTIEGVLALIGIVATATMWIVNAIHGVRDSIKDLAVSLHEDIKRHDQKLDNHESRLQDLEA